MKKCKKGHLIFRRSHLFCPKCSVPLFPLNDSVPNVNPEAEDEEEKSLSCDIVLAFESISLSPSGHVGSETKYLHEQRIVTCKKWGIDHKGNQINAPKEVYEVPPHITTERELRSYIMEKRFAPPRQFSFLKTEAGAGC